MKETRDASLGMHLLEIEITHRCDKDCCMCYLDKPRTKLDLPLNIVKELISFCEEENVSTIVITGGEACLHPEFIQLIDWLRINKPKARMIIQSNGLIGKKSLDLFDVFHAVHLSYDLDDSPARSTSSEYIIDLAKRLKQRGVYSYLFGTIHAKNIDNLDLLIKRANQAEIDVGFNLYTPQGGDDDLVLGLNERAVVSQKLADLHRHNKILRHTCALTAIVENKKTKKYEGNKGGCTAGIGACSVTPKGDVIPCPFLRVKAGNIFEEHIADIWLTSSVLNNLRDRSLFDDPCGSCQFLSYCGGCRARALKSSGRLNGSDPACFKDVYVFRD